VGGRGPSKQSASPRCVTKEIEESYSPSAWRQKKGEGGRRRVVGKKLYLVKKIEKKRKEAIPASLLSRWGGKKKERKGGGGTNPSAFVQRGRRGEEKKKLLSHPFCKSREKARGKRSKNQPSPFCRRGEEISNYPFSRERRKVQSPGGGLVCLGRGVLTFHRLP